MEQVLYAKFSNQRKKEFEIATKICSDENGKYILKEALNETGITHINNMVKNYSKLNDVFTESGWEINRCKQVDEKTISFEFVSGDTLEDEISNAFSRDDYDTGCSIIFNFAQNVYNNSHIKLFKANDGFEKIFGKRTLREDLHAFDVSDVDMIFSNFIIRDSDMVLLDYEWTYNFQIPIEFIMFRSLYHSSFVQKLDADLLNTVYKKLNIQTEDIAIFKEMENDFQSYVSGTYNDFQKIHERIGNDTIPLTAVDTKVFNRYQIVLGEECVTGKTLQNDIFIHQELHSDDDIIVILNVMNGIYKIKSAYGYKNSEKNELEIINHNAELVIINDYYFNNEKPQIIFKNDGYDKVEIAYEVITRASNIIHNLIESINSSKKGRDKVSLLEDRTKQLEHDLQLYKDKAQEYIEAYNTASAELDQIHSTLLWKIGAKLKSGKSE